MQELKAQTQAMREHPKNDSLNPSVAKVSTNYSSKNKSVTCADGWREAAKESCQYVKTGVLVEDSDTKNIGRILRVCMAKNACKKHWPECQSKSAPARSAAKVAEERRKAEIETLYTQGLLATVYKHVRKPIRDDWEMVGAELWALLKWWKLGENGHEQICAALGITDPDDITKHLASLTDAEILRFVIALAAAATSANSLTLLEGIAKRHAIDTKQIRKDATVAVKAQATSSKK